jgi:prephenate dehydratase
VQLTVTDGRLHTDAAVALMLSVALPPLFCQSVSDGSADCALVPIENSLGGSIHGIAISLLTSHSVVHHCMWSSPHPMLYVYWLCADCYDLLVVHDVVIVAELEFAVHHCLMSLPGQALDAIHTVISHPQALAQCEDFITNLRLKAEKQYDTAGSARLIRDNGLQGVAAIASSLAAEAYGLHVLASHCEDDDNNYTRSYSSQNAKHRDHHCSIRLWHLRLPPPLLPPLLSALMALCDPQMSIHVHSPPYSSLSRKMSRRNR